MALSSNWKRSSTLVVSPKRKSEVLIVHVCSCAPFLRFHSYEEPVSQSMLHCGMMSGPVVAPGQSGEKAISTCAFAVITKESRDNKQTIILHFISFCRHNSYKTASVPNIVKGHETSYSNDSLSYLSAVYLSKSNLCVDN